MKKGAAFGTFASALVPDHPILAALQYGLDFKACTATPSPFAITTSFGTDNSLVSDVARVLWSGRLVRGVEDVLGERLQVTSVADSVSDNEGFERSLDVNLDYAALEARFMAHLRRHLLGFTAGQDMTRPQRFLFMLSGSKYLPLSRFQKFQVSLCVDILQFLR